DVLLLSTAHCSLLTVVMDLDAKVCYCFHVNRRKLVNYVRVNRPKVPSQLSECGGAGTGCGWCIPFLKQIFEQAASGRGTGPRPCAAARSRAPRPRVSAPGNGHPAPRLPPFPTKKNQKFIAPPNPRRRVFEPRGFFQPA